MASGQRGHPPGPLGTLTEPPCPETDSDEQLLERFVRSRDEEAFASLVRRHGPMVFGVCRRVLGDRHAAEDAFQSAFLVLARKAGSLGRPHLLANWLYGVAFRVARKARDQTDRRRVLESQAIPMSPSDPLDEITWRELCTSLDEELNRLPEKYRAPLVLCYLEGKTNAEAARLLGWPPGSMSARLARGRELLRERLGGRRRALPSAMFLLLLEHESAAAPFPGLLVEGTVRAALKMAAVPASPAAQAAAPGGEAAAPGGSPLPARPVRGWLLAALLLITLGGGLYAYNKLSDDGSQGLFLPPSAAPGDPSAGGCHAAPPEPCCETP